MIQTTIDGEVKAVENGKYPCSGSIGDVADANPPEMGAYTLTMLEGVISVNAKGIELLFGSGKICLGIHLGVRSLLKCAERNGAMVIEIFRGTYALPVFRHCGL